MRGVCARWGKAMSSGAVNVPRQSKIDGGHFARGGGWLPEGESPRALAATYFFGSSSPISR